MAKSFTFDGIKSGQIFQMGILVPDIDASMRFYAQTLKIGPFTCARGFRAPDGWYRGSTEMPELTLAHAWTGRLFVELIQQHDDTPSVYKEFSDKHGYGLHHLGIAVAPEDYDETLARYYAQGFENIFTDQLPSGARVKYTGPKSEEGIEKLRNECGVRYIEFVEFVDVEERFFTGVYKEYLDWNGEEVLSGTKWP